MMNGNIPAGIEPKKPLFGFMAKPAEPAPEKRVNKDIADPVRAKDTILVKEGKPIYALYALARYYIHLQKYKAIVKFDLDHKAYFSKRDAIIKMAQDKSLQQYWLASILSTICV